MKPSREPLAAGFQKVRAPDAPGGMPHLGRGGGGVKAGGKAFKTASWSLIGRPAPRSPCSQQGPLIRVGLGTPARPHCGRGRCAPMPLRAEGTALLLPAREQDAPPPACGKAWGRSGFRSLGVGRGRGAGRPGGASRRLGAGAKVGCGASVLAEKAAVPGDSQPS